MNSVLHYLEVIAPQVHSMASAMTALCFVMFCVSGFVGWVQSAFTGKPATAWRFFFAGIVAFGLLWALFPAK